MVKVTWRTLHSPCLLHRMGTHGWSLLLILGLCPSRATWFGSWLYFTSVICPGSRVFIFTVISKVLGRFTQDHTCEARSRHQVNKCKLLPLTSILQLGEEKTASLCRELIVFHAATSSAEKKFNDEDSCPWLWAYHGLGFCQERGSMISFNTYKRTLWRAQNHRWQHWDLNPDPRPPSRSWLLHIIYI